MRLRYRVNHSSYTCAAWRKTFSLGREKIVSTNFLSQRTFFRLNGNSFRLNENILRRDEIIFVSRKTFFATTNFFFLNESIFPRDENYFLYKNCSIYFPVLFTIFEYHWDKYSKSPRHAFSWIKIVMLRIYAVESTGV